MVQLTTTELTLHKVLRKDKDDFSTLCDRVGNLFVDWKADGEVPQMPANFVRRVALLEQVEYLVLYDSPHFIVSAYEDIVDKSITCYACEREFNN